MIRKVLITAVAAALLYGQAHACIDHYAAYYTGMVLNNGETLNLSRIESLTSDQQSYLKVCFYRNTSNGEVVIDSSITLGKQSPASTNAAADSVERCSYKFRSIFKSDAMVFIGYAGGELGLYGNVPRMLIYFDTTAVPTNEAKAAALKAEIQRFSGLGILSMSDAAITRAVAAIGSTEGQYWTKQDTILPYNMWFDSASLGGVYGVRDANGACGAGIAYELPERAYGITDVTAGGLKLLRNTSGVSLHAVADGRAIRIAFAPVAGNRAHLIITDFAGHRAASVSLEKQATGLTLNRSGLVSGIYLVSIFDGNGIVQSGRLVLAGR